MNRLLIGCLGMALGLLIIMPWLYVTLLAVIESQ